MKQLRMWASVLCLVLLSIRYSTSNAQVDVTGNLTNFGAAPTATTTTWQNVGQYGGSLNCWSWFDSIWGNYCGPQPFVNANGYGSINFSYGSTDLNQTVTVANALPNRGAGLQVNGFQFSFRAKNGNGWDNGQTDNLNAYVNLYSPKGASVGSYNYNLTYQYNWTDFNFNETFTKPHTTASLGTIRYGFVGSDSNYWLGPYGPEVTNVNFRLKYSVDPCSVNPLSSSSCPGYGAAFAAQMRQNTAPTAAATTTTVISAPAADTSSSSSTSLSPAATQTATKTGTLDTTSTDATVTSAGGVDVKPGGTIVAPDNIPQVVKETATKASVNTAAINTALERVQHNREQNRAQALSVLQSANEAAQQSYSGQESLVNDILTRNADQARQSAENSFAPVTTVAAYSSSATGPYRTDTRQQQSSSSTGTDTVLGTGLQLRLPELPRAPQYEPQYTAPTVIAKLDAKTPEVASSGTGITASHTDPVGIVLRNELPQQSSQSSSQGPTVNRSAPNSSVAGNVNIENIQRTPQGFELYMAGMTDRPFYAPKEIYRGQRTVDNARAERFLNNSSEIRHQMMIEQQYNLGR